MTSSHATDVFVPRLARVGVRTDERAAKELLGVLLLPAKLEQFEFAQHARELLEIPRVIALEPGRVRTPGFLRDALPVRQVKRLRLPGEPRVLVLYHPAQYPLARAFCGRYPNAELWYLRARDVPAGRNADELTALDELAQERAVETRAILDPDERAAAEDALRLRLQQLDIISPRPFVPGARIPRR